MKHHKRPPYRNRMATIRAPKPEAALVDRTGHEQDTGHSSSYRWNQCLYVGAGIAGSGEADERKAWRCADCGVEAGPVEKARRSGRRFRDGDRWHLPEVRSEAGDEGTGGVTRVLFGRET